MLRTLLILVLGFASCAAFAQVPVEVSGTARDSVGQRLVFAVKERIRTSSSMSLTIEEKPRIRLALVTLEGNTSSPGNYTVYSAVWLWDGPALGFPYYLTSSAGYCGSTRANECAEDLVAKTYEEWEKIERLLRSAKSK